MSKGHIFPDYFVDCGLCNTSNACSEYRYDEAVKSAREMGWHLTKAHGWLCPICYDGLVKLRREKRKGKQHE